MNRICRTEKHEEASRGGTGELPTKPVATIPQSAFRVPQSRASALITTLLVLVVLSTIVVAFMQSMSVERSVSRSVKNKFQAREAAEAGLEYFLATVTRLSTNYSFNVVNVVTNNASYLFIGSPIGGLNTNAVFTPLFSGGAVQTNSLFQNPVVSLTTNQTVATNKPLVPPYASIPRVAWIEKAVTNSGIVGKIRFCFAASDLEGAINVGISGNTNGPSGIHSRTTNSNPASIALYTLFNTNSQSDIGDTLAKAIVENRSSIISTETLLQLGTNMSNAMGSMALRVGTYVEPEVIPVGFGYADEGKPKFNLNSNVSAGGTAAVDQLSGIIASNLPFFEAGRKGGFNRGEYVKTLAANIVDYVDADSDPTLSSNYRGVDSYPFVNLIFRRYAWTSGTGGVGGPITIIVRTFVDLWNPSSKTATGSLGLQYNDSNGVTIGGNAFNFTTETFPLRAVTLPPNGHLVIEAGNQTYTFPSVTAVASPLSWKNMSGNSDSTFRLTWNGSAVDEFRGGAENVGSETGSSLLAGDSNRRFKGNAVALDYGTGVVGDPRASYYITSRVFARTYDSSSAWGGRQFAAGINNTDFKEVRFSRWPDPGNDGPAFPSVTSEILTGNDSVQAGAESPLGSSTAPWFIPQNARGTWRGFGPGTLPTAIQLPPTFTNLAPAIISNSGLFTNIFELGNIFDPSQWSDVTSSNAVASGAAGGGYTLRVGQIDFPAFNIYGRRASQLIDLFTLSSTMTNAGMININTASRDALRALVAGTLYATNQNLQPTNRMIYAARSSGGAAADRFADAVINSRPFFSRSQLAYISNQLGPYFGNANQWSGNTNEGPTMWNDVAREQLFSDVYPLVSVKSRNFRVYVCGQLLDSKDKVISSVDAVVNVFAKPVINGTQVTVTPVRVYVKSN